MLLIGLLVGRWAAVPFGGLGWAVALLASGSVGWVDVPTATFLGAVNMAAGVVAHQIVAFALRLPRALSRS